MRRRSFISGFGFTLLAISFSYTAISAGSITGVVLDRGEDPPIGISGVTVQVRLPNGKLLDIKVITDTDGEFSLKEVPNGNYTIVLNKVGYIPRPDESKKLKVKGRENAGQIKLMKAYATAGYFSVVATDIVKMASAAKDQKGKIYVEEWWRLRVIGLPPSSKALVAAGIEKQDQTAKRYLPEMKTYLAAKPEDIRKTEHRFEMALVGKMSLPSKEEANEMKVGQEIVADIVLMQARNGSVPKERRTALVKEFQRKWEGTKAEKIFADHQKEGFDKNPTHLPFQK